MDKFDNGINLILCDGPLHSLNLVNDFKILYKNTPNIKTVKGLKKFINSNKEIISEKPILIITHLKSFENYFIQNNVDYNLFKCSRYYFQSAGSVGKQEFYKLFYVFYSIKNFNGSINKEMFFKFSKEEFRTLIRQAKINQILEE